MQQLLLGDRHAFLHAKKTARGGHLSTILFKGYMAPIQVNRSVLKA
jgi:hypothetical protein